jgi:hypothetical protein
MVAKASPAILAALFRRFQRRVHASEGQRLSMREVSADLAVKEAMQPGRTGDDKKPDVNALARWTNPKKPNWYIPVGRVQEVAVALGATQNEVDALMLVRLKELAAHNPQHDALVCGAWVAQRITQNLRLAPDEEAVLAAYRRAAEPAGTLGALGPARLERLAQVMQDLVQEALKEDAAEAAFPDTGLALADEQHRIARARALQACARPSKIVDNPTAAHPRVRNVPRAVIVKELFARLRSTRNSSSK